MPVLRNVATRPSATERVSQPLLWENGSALSQERRSLLVTTPSTRNCPPKSPRESHSRVVSISPSPGVAKSNQTACLEPKQVKRGSWWVPATNAIVTRQKCPSDLTLRKGSAVRTGPKRRAIWSWDETPSHTHYFCCCRCHQSYAGNKICNCFLYTLGRFTSSNRQCTC